MSPSQATLFVLNTVPFFRCSLRVYKKKLTITKLKSNANKTRITNYKEWLSLWRRTSMGWRRKSRNETKPFRTRLGEGFLFIFVDNALEKHLIGWFTDCLSDRLNDLMTHRHIDLLANWSIDRLVGCLIDLLSSWLTEIPTGDDRLTNRQEDQSTD